MNYSYFSKFPIDGVLVIFNEIFFLCGHFDHSSYHHGNQFVGINSARVRDFIPKIDPLTLHHFRFSGASRPVLSKCMFQ